MKRKLAILGGDPAMPEGIERARWPRYSQAELDELCRVLREEQLGGCDAPQIAALEQEWSQRMGTDFMAEGFRKVFSQIDEVAKLQLPGELLDGGAANLDEIRRGLGAALPVQPT